VFLSALLPLTGQRAAFFSLAGWFDAEAYRAASRLPPEALSAPIGWSLTYAIGDGVSFDIFWFGGLAVLVLFTLGIATRLTAPLTWVILVSFLATPAAHADADYLLAILAFYLMLGYALYGYWSRPLSALERLFGPRGTFLFAGLRGKTQEPTPSYAANLAMRLIQVHFAIIVVTSGLHKLQDGDWWRGAAFWYPLHPPFEMDVNRFHAERSTINATLFVLSLAGYLTLAWQLAFPVIAFTRRLRPLLVGGAALGWVGCAFLFREPTFGPMFALCCLSYLTADEWEWVADWVRAPFRRRGGATEKGEDRRSRAKVAAVREQRG
jgi:hypothetical protein